MRLQLAPARALAHPPTTLFFGHAGTYSRRSPRGAAMTIPAPAGSAVPQGQLTFALHVSLAPTWFDPAETQALITPFMVPYALHDAMAKPMPDKLCAP
jgi:hypothetical protein